MGLVFRIFSSQRLALVAIAISGGWNRCYHTELNIAGFGLSLNSAFSAYTGHIAQLLTKTINNINY